MKNIKEKVIEKIEPTLDKYFPKGEKFSRRGEALALFSLTLIETLTEVGKVIDDLEREEWGDDVIFASKLKQKLGIMEKKLR